MKKKNNTLSQHQAFMDAARELGADQTEASFDKALGQIARANVPKDAVTPKQRRAKRAKAKAKAKAKG